MNLLVVIGGLMLVVIVLIIIILNSSQKNNSKDNIDKLTDEMQEFAKNIKSSNLNLTEGVQTKGVIEAQRDNENKVNKQKEVKEFKNSPFEWVPASEYKAEKVVPKMNDENDSSYSNKIDVDAIKRLESLQKVLLVDDSATVLNFTGKLLRNNNFNVVLKEDGVKALSYLLSEVKNIPDIIVSDIEMPNMDGIELIKKIREQNKFKNIPIIIISASAERHLELMENGLIQGFLHKPFKEPDLISQINYLLEND